MQKLQIGSGPIWADFPNLHWHGHCMGFAGEGYVLPVRRLFSRDRGDYTRTLAWVRVAKGW